MTKPLLKAFVYSPPSLSSSDDDDMSIATSDKLDVPLLNDQATSHGASSDDNDVDSTQQQDAEKINLLKRYGILIGSFVGISLVLSQLGLQVLLLLALRHVDPDVQHTKTGWTIIALPWITMTALAVFFVMHLFLRVASTTYSMGNNRTTQLDEVLLESLQIRFLVGTLIGAFLSSIALDTCIGTSSDDLLFNAAALLASLTPYVTVKILESRFVRRRKATHKKKLDQENNMMVV